MVMPVTRNEAGETGARDNPKKGGYRLGTEIERTTDLRKVLEERILDNKVQLLLREVLGIAKEFHDSIVDLVKRKRLSTEPEPEKLVELWTTNLEDIGGGIGTRWFGDQLDVHGLLQEGQVADQHQARVENTSDDARQGGGTCSLPECTSENR